MATTGSGTTIVNATTANAFVGRVQKIGAWPLTREVLNDTPLDHDDYEEYVFGEVTAHGGIPVDVLHDGAEKIPRLGKATGAASNDTWTITFKSGAALTGTAGIVQFNSSEQAANQRTLTSFVLQFDGKTGPTLSGGS